MTVTLQAAIKSLVKNALRSRGLLLIPMAAMDGRTADLSASTLRIYETVKPYTMTSVERVASLLDAVDYIVSSSIPGDIVECGVWRGGSMMAVATRLMELGQRRALRLFDTFTGMPSPGQSDIDLKGSTAIDHMDDSAVRASCDLEDVRRNIGSTGYPEVAVHYIPGCVEDTLPACAPKQIALLRLDTDWYESTLHELVHLWPRVARGGVVILDDYGHWQGARKATEEYFASNGPRPYLHRIDYTGRLILKP